jgi:acyl carrier protein
VEEQLVSAANGIQTRVAKVLAEALGVEEEDVTPASALHADLGAESIDLLDIVFRLEREFGIHIDRDELFPESIFQGDPEFVREGLVTDSGLAKLRASLPHADLHEFETDRRLSAIPNLFTAGLVAGFVAWKLGSPNGVDKSVRGLETVAPSPGN